MPEETTGYDRPPCTSTRPGLSRSRLASSSTPPNASAGPSSVVSRYRELRGGSGTAVLFESPTASTARASAVVRFGPDGKLYLAVDREGPEGRLFRLNTDGTLPRDQAGTTPAIATGIVGPRGLEWDPRSRVLWIADGDSEQSHVSAVALSDPPVRAMVRGPPRSAAGNRLAGVLHDDVLPGMRGDALDGVVAGIHPAPRLAADDARSRRFGTPAGSAAWDRIRVWFWQAPTARSTSVPTTRWGC